jgi:ketosteroid isomerase-like protein
MREDIIRNYIEAYNSFDVERMLADLDANVRFVNISDGVVNMILEGRHKFREQAEQAQQLFSARRQTIRAFKHTGNETEVEIDYYGVLAGDLPNGMKKDDELNLQGRSVFKFEDEKVVEIRDFS